MKTIRMTDVPLANVSFSKIKILAQHNGNKSPRLEQIFEITDTSRLLIIQSRGFLNIILLQADA